MKESSSRPSNAGGRISVRELQRSNQKKFRRAEDAEEVLKNLVELGHGRWVGVPTTVAGGKPSKEFVLSGTCDGTDETPSASATESAERTEVVGSVGFVTPLRGSAGEEPPDAPAEKSGDRPPAASGWQEGDL